MSQEGILYNYTLTVHFVHITLPQVIQVALAPWIKQDSMTGTKPKQHLFQREFNLLQTYLVKVDAVL